MPAPQWFCWGCGASVPVTELQERTIVFASPRGTNLVPSSTYDPAYWRTQYPVEKNAQGSYPDYRRKRLLPDNTYRVIRAAYSIRGDDAAECDVSFPEGGQWFFGGDFGLVDLTVDDRIEVTITLSRDDQTVFVYGPRIVRSSASVLVPFLTVPGLHRLRISSAGSQRWWFDCLTIKRQYDDFIYTMSGPVIGAQGGEKRAVVKLCAACAEGEED